MQCRWPAPGERCLVPFSSGYRNLLQAAVYPLEAPLLGLPFTLAAPKYKISALNSLSLASSFFQLLRCHMLV